MSTTQHTPGPWRWEIVADNSGKQVALLLVTDHRPIPLNDPVIFALREDWMAAFGSEELDAHLIAAAPDLLQAALDMAEASRRGYDLPWGTLRAAISKATGWSTVMTVKESQS
jgi:hypothetical protein